MGTQGRDQFHAGLTPDSIVVAAVELTAESSLLSWSIRELGARLGVAPSVIYHHVGGRDIIARRVVESVFADLPAPDPELAWQEWFAALLWPMRERALRYPGTASWLLMHGPVFPQLLPVIDAGIATLQRAGFAELTGFAYSAMINNAIMLLAVADERRHHEADGPRDHATMMREFTSDGLSSPGAQALAHTLIGPFAAGGEAAARASRDYYDFTIKLTSAGLEGLLQGRWQAPHRH